MNKLFRIKYKTKAGERHEIEIVCEHLVDAMALLQRYEGSSIYPSEVVSSPMKMELVK